MNFQSASRLQWCWRYILFNPWNATLIASSARMFHLLFLKDLSISSTWRLLSKAPQEQKRTSLNWATVYSFRRTPVTVMLCLPAWCATLTILIERFTILWTADGNFCCCWPFTERRNLYALQSSTGGAVMHVMFRRYKGDAMDANGEIRDKRQT